MAEQYGVSVLTSESVRTAQVSAMLRRTAQFFTGRSAENRYIHDPAVRSLLLRWISVYAAFARSRGSMDDKRAARELLKAVLRKGSAAVSGSGPFWDVVSLFSGEGNLNAEQIGSYEAIQGAYLDASLPELRQAWDNLSMSMKG